MAQQLEKAAPKHEPLTIEEAQSVLMRAARNVGRVYGVGLSVGRQSNGLVFVDDVGETVTDDFCPEGPLVIPACSEEEIASGMFLQLFTGRAAYAAMALKFMEMLESEQP